jgi:ribosomal protein L4
MKQRAFAARNIREATLVTSSSVNTEQLLAFRKVIVTEDALTELAKRTSNP